MQSHKHRATQSMAHTLYHRGEPAKVKQSFTSTMQNKYETTYTFDAQEQFLYQHYANILANAKQLKLKIPTFLEEYLLDIMDDKKRMRQYSLFYILLFDGKIKTWASILQKEYNLTPQMIKRREMQYPLFSHLIIRWTDHCLKFLNGECYRLHSKCFS